MGQGRGAHLVDHQGRLTAVFYHEIEPKPGTVARRPAVSQRLGPEGIVGDHRGCIPGGGARSGAVMIPVIAAGGAGSLQDLVDIVTEGHASAVAAASIFHFTDQSPIKAHPFMTQAGLDVRMA